MGKTPQILPVIMSGGSGTRLWPLSTDAKPKQFHALASDLTMIQDTAQRFVADSDLHFLKPLVICSDRHGRLAVEQLSKTGFAPAAVIQEPFGRNTASVAVVAAQWAAENTPDALVLLLPADHVVADVAAFRSVIATALKAATSHIVTLGVKPTEPQTGYGYIQRGAALYEGAFEVKRFVEKPDRATAQAYIQDGGYSWNAGIFLYRPEVLLEEAARYCANVVEASTAALTLGAREGLYLTLDPEALGACPSVPIDIAIMEKTARAAVVPCSVGWADVGSWSELWRQGPHDAHDNVTRGAVLALDAKGSIIWSDGPPVAALGVEDLIIVATKDYVMVLPRHRAQDVKMIVDALKKGDLP